MASTEERKRKRLEAWRRKQQQQQSAPAAAPPQPPPPPAVPAPKVTLSLSNIGGLNNVKKKKILPVKKQKNAFFDIDDDEDSADEGPSRKRPLDMNLLDPPEPPEPAKKKKKKSSRRWDNKAENVPDALDKFMDQLQSGEMAQIHTEELSIDVSGSMVANSTNHKSNPVSGGVMTASQLEQRYQPNDWLSDTSPSDTEDEEQARRALIDALKSAPVPTSTMEDEAVMARPAQLAAEVKSEKSRREERLRELERQAAEARTAAESAPEVGWLYNDDESGVMEEAERNLSAAKAAPDALEVLAELNKKKELKAVDHSKVDYLPITKNLYRVPRALAQLSNDEVVDRRAKLKVRVRGHGAPAPVSSFEECGLSEKILKILEQQGITKPFAVQSQCIPCIMAGRDVIGIAKTGSGKTLAYLLPMLRHILAQPPLEPNESVPSRRSLRLASPSRSTPIRKTLTSMAIPRALKPPRSPRLGLLVAERRRQSATRSQIATTTTATSKGPPINGRMTTFRKGTHSLHDIICTLTSSLRITTLVRHSTTAWITVDNDDSDF